MSVDVEGVGKRYVKYEDAPLLLHRVMRLRASTTRTALWALRDISFAVDPGTCLGIIGRNGSGKSTMLRLLAGVTAPTEGRVAVRGRIAPLIAVGVGFHPELTGRENVYVNGTILGLSRRQLDDRFDEIVAFAEIDDFIDTPVKFYSSGMLVRLGFAVSVLAEPEVLLVDEVLAVGDIAFQMKCLDRMAAIKASGTTIVLVSHNLNAVRRMCDRTIVLHDGTVRHDGDTNEAVSAFHDLLGEPRDHEAPSDSITDGSRVEDRLVVDRFDVLGPDGARTNSVESGDEVTLRLRFSAARDVDDAVLGVDVISESGVHVYGDTTPWRDRWSAPAGSSFDVDVRLRLGLASGSYELVVGAARADGTSLLRTPARALVYVHGRSTARGVADLGAAFDVGSGADTLRE